MAKQIGLIGGYVQIIDDALEVSIKNLPLADTLITIDKQTLDVHFFSGNQKVTVPNEDLPGLTTLPQVLAFVSSLLESSLPKTANNALLVGTAEDRFYTQFFDFNTTTDWEIRHATALSGLAAFAAGAHPNMPVTGPLGGAAAGCTPYVNIASGVTPNVATLLLARPIVKSPVEVRVGITMSQRIANNTVLVGFFECDPVTGELLRGNQYRNEESVLNVRNLAAFLLDGTTATSANMAYRASESGLSLVGSTAFSGFTTVAGGSGPNFTVPDELVLNFDRDRVTFRSVDLNQVISSGGTVISRSDGVPNPTRSYRFGVIVINSGAPASNTDVRLHFVSMLDSSRVDVSPRYTASDLNKAFPVAVLGNPAMQGQVAHDGPVAGNPLQLGADARSANPAAVSATGDVARLLATMIGVLVTKPHAIQEAAWNYTGQLTTTSDVAIQTAAGAGLRRHITGLVATNTGAAAVSLLLRDGTTTRFTVTIPAGQSLTLDLEGLMVVTANTALNAQLSAAGTVQVAAWGYTAP